MLGRPLDRHTIAARRDRSEVAPGDEAAPSGSAGSAAAFALPNPCPTSRDTCADLRPAVALAAGWDCHTPAWPDPRTRCRFEE